MKTYRLCAESAHCCGCGCCAAICPKHAISMKQDLNGFLCPQIDESICIDCGFCLKHCAFQQQDIEVAAPIQSYAAVRKNRQKLKLSSSGGLFAVMAEAILEQNGVICGCSLEHKNGRLYPMHILVENRENLQKLFGSKYVQSDLYSVLPELKKVLQTGRLVLFCGTPCQVAGVKSFLKKKYENLWLIDLICHGVPSVKMFQDYLAYMEKKRVIQIQNIQFRTKTGQVGHHGAIEYINRYGKQVKEPFEPKLSSYYSCFLESSNFRESCYVCPYANFQRVGDITIGDFWGFAKHYPDYDPTLFNPCDGISAVMINTQKGLELYHSILPEISVHPSDYESIAERNPQIVSPSIKSPYYAHVMQTYRDGGYAAVEKIYSLRIRKYKLKQKIKKYIPKILYNRLKNKS